MEPVIVKYISIYIYICFTFYCVLVLGTVQVRTTSTSKNTVHPSTTAFYIHVKT